jgi:hypothetical protein
VDVRHWILHFVPLLERLQPVPRVKFLAKELDRQAEPSSRFLELTSGLLAPAMSSNMAWRSASGCAPVGTILNTLPLAEYTSRHLRARLNYEWR